MFGIQWKQKIFRIMFCLRKLCQGVQCLHDHPPVGLPTGALQGRQCATGSAPGAVLRGAVQSPEEPAAGCGATDRLCRRSMQSPGPISQQQPHPCTQTPRISQPPVDQPPVDASSAVATPYSLLRVCTGTCKGNHHNNFWQLSFLYCKH